MPAPDRVVIRWADTEPAAAAAGARSPDDVAVLPRVEDDEVVVAVVPPTGRDRAAVRRAVAVAARRARQVAEVVGAPRVELDLDAVEPSWVAEGAALGWYRYRPGATQDAAAPVLVADDSVVARAVVRARDWVTAPPNLQDPATLARQLVAAAEEQGLAHEVLDEQALADGGYGGLTAVGGGSARGPRLVRVAYDPGTGPHVVLVGKGITFDSGGLDLKSAAGMATMRHDMAGAATVVATTVAVAELGLPVRVTAYAPLAENLPSATAFRPSDVVTTYGGTTVEVGNTDAEGRLVLADALVRATEDEPDLVVDVATLTGAVITALGTRTIGLFARRDEDAARVVAAAEAAGERVWRLPIGPEDREALASDVADLRSTNSDHRAGASFAAAFLERFVGDTSWAHLDVAGVAWNRGSAYGEVPPMGTGAGVATLLELARGLTD